MGDMQSYIVELLATKVMVEGCKKYEVQVGRLPIGTYKALRKQGIFVHKSEDKFFYRLFGR